MGRKSGQLVLLVSTCPDSASARLLAEEILAKELAACVQIDGPVQSHYIWDGAVESAEEWRIHIKTSESKLSVLEKCIISLHPYEIPQIIRIPISANESYQQWVHSVLPTD